MYNDIEVKQLYEHVWNASLAFWTDDIVKDTGRMRNEDDYSLSFLDH